MWTELQARIVQQALATSLLAWPAAASAQEMNPAGSAPVNATLSWLQGTLMGTVATTVAVMAVATIGFLLLSGHANWRFGATVIIGLFILFGATTIVPASSRPQAEAQP